MLAGNIIDLLFICDNLHLYNFAKNESKEIIVSFVSARLSTNKLVSC